LASFAGRTPIRVRVVPTATSICAATAVTASGGIKELDRFGAERVALEPEYAVKVDPASGSVGVLVEPAAVLAKACEQIDRPGRSVAARWAAWLIRERTEHPRLHRPRRGEQ
jgi:hypothetical protein